MSGGFFNYDQARIKNMIDSIEELIEKNEQLQSQVAKYEMIIDDLDSENFFLGQQVAQKERVLGHLPLPTSERAKACVGPPVQEPTRPQP